jgi:predicted nucleotidyltransferase
LGDGLAGVILYGSYARGDFHEWSDVDIMLLVDEEDQLEVQQIDKLVFDNLDSLGFEMLGMLSVLSVSWRSFCELRNVSFLYRNVTKEGVLLYVRSQQAC